MHTTPNSDMTITIRNRGSSLEVKKVDSVEDMPVPGKSNFIYFVPSSKTSSKNVYDEYIWVASTNSFELLGTLSTDLSDYVTFTLLNRALATIAPIETTSAASADYAVGDYLIAYDGTAKTWNFYKVTTAIATG